MDNTTYTVTPRNLRLDVIDELAKKKKGGLVVTNLMAKFAQYGYGDDNLQIILSQAGNKDDQVSAIIRVAAKRSMRMIANDPTGWAKL